MNTYGIMRVEKRTRDTVYGLQIEANRTKEDHEKGRDFSRSDIDWEKTGDNVHFVRTENWNREITRQLGEAGVKERKGSVVLLDALYTASAEWFTAHSDREEQLDFFRACLQFHRKEYGDRVINAVVHFDETTPHMQVASIPIIEDEKGAHLSAKIIMGGRDDYRKRQDRFYEEVSRQYGMERGEVRAPEEMKAHTTKREWQLAVGEELIEESTRMALEARQRQLDEEFAAEQAQQRRVRLEEEATAAEIRMQEAGNLAEQYEETLTAVREANDKGDDFIGGFGKTLTGKATLSEEQVERVKELQAAVFWKDRQYENAVEKAALKEKTIERLKQSLTNAQEAIVEQNERVHEAEHKAELWDKLLSIIDRLKDSAIKHVLTEIVQRLDRASYERGFSMER